MDVFNFVSRWLKKISDQFVRYTQFSQTTYIFILGIFVGIGGGLVSIGFRWLITASINPIRNEIVNSIMNTMKHKNKKKSILRRSMKIKRFFAV